MNEYTDQSEAHFINNDINARKSNYLMQNHNKLIEKITEKCSIMQNCYSN